MAHILQIKVIPSSGRKHIQSEPSGLIKCYLKSQPEKGKANLELIKMLAKKLQLPQAAIAIISGATSRNKRVSFDTELSLEQVYARLGIEFPQLTIL